MIGYLNEESGDCERTCFVAIGAISLYFKTSIERFARDAELNLKSSNKILHFRPNINC